LHRTDKYNGRSKDITITSGYDDNSGEDVFFTHLAEVGIY
jgi:hypothetical protein